MKPRRPSPRTAFAEEHGAAALGVFAPALDLLGRVRDRLGREPGQTLTEYSLILAFVALVCITALTVIGGAVNDFLTEMATRV
jgi:pilus assembly protein Flp/PilA